MLAERVDRHALARAFGALKAAGHVGPCDIPQVGGDATLAGHAQSNALHEHPERVP